MLEEILGFLYISWLCWTFGKLSFSFMGKFFRHETPSEHFSILCITGLVLMGACGGLLSLFIPLGGAGVQIFFSFCSLIYWLSVPRIRTSFMQGMNFRKLPALPVLVVTLLLVLIWIMGVATIIHPDTLTYHAQLIRWIQQYRVTPGLAHLHIRYGLQSNWFVLCALLSFPFTHTHAFTFINTTVAAWFILFAGSLINTAFQRGQDEPADYRPALLTVALLCFAIGDFGLLRLTTASTSPDFVAALYIWLPIYLLFRSPGNPFCEVLAVVFGLFAVTIKLSCVPTLILCGYFAIRFIRKQQYRSLTFSVLAAIVLLVPFLVRNYITSGYILFPSVFPDIFNPEWKLPPQPLRDVVAYVANFAKVQDAAELGINSPVIVQRFSDWMPLWWKMRPFPQKAEMVVLVIALLAGMFRIKKIFRLTSLTQKFIVLTSIAAVIFWFVQGPDPRFGYGFIVATPAIIFYLLTSQGSWNKPSMKWLINLSLAVLCVGTLRYSVYRLEHYFRFQNMVFADGAPVCPYTEKVYQHVRFFVPPAKCDCSGTPAPCMDEAPKYELRGKTVTQGFKAIRPTALPGKEP